MINQNQSCGLKTIFIVVISMIFFAKFNNNWILFKKIHEVWLKFKNSENQLISMNSVSEKSINELLEISQVCYRLINTQNCGLYLTENCLSKSDNKVLTLPVYNFGSWSVFSVSDLLIRSIVWTGICTCRWHFYWFRNSIWIPKNR